MQGQLFVLLLGLIASLVSGLDPPQGCEVENVLKIDPVKYDSVRFHAYVDDTETVFRAQLMCTGGHSDFLTLTSNHSLTFERIRWGSKNGSTKKVFEPINLEPGWHNFDLQVVGKYDLTDDQGQSWISEEVNATCEVTKVTIDEGILMRHCLEGVPTWVVSGTKHRDIPLGADEGQTEKEELIFFSRKTFRPVLTLNKKRFNIGWDDGILQVNEEDVTEGLPPFVQHRLSFLMTKDYEDNTKVKLFHDTKEIFSMVLKQHPTKMRLHGKQRGQFVVLQTLKEKRSDDYETFLNQTDSTDGLKEGLRRMKNASVFSDALTIGLAAGLTVSLSAILGLVVFRRIHRYMNRNKIRRYTIPAKPSNDKDQEVKKDCGGGTTTKAGKRGCESMYLHPLPHAPQALHPLPPINDSHKFQGPKGKEEEEEWEEAIYEEIGNPSPLEEIAKN